MPPRRNHEELLLRIQSQNENDVLTKVTENSLIPKLHKTNCKTRIPNELPILTLNIIIARFFCSKKQDIFRNQLSVRNFIVIFTIWMYLRSSVLLWFHNYAQNSNSNSNVARRAFRQHQSKQTIETCWLLLDAHLLRF